MPRAIPFWTNAVSAVNFANGESASSSLTFKGLRLCDILDHDAHSDKECWDDVLLANYMIDFSWLLQAVPSLRDVRGQVVVLSGERGTSTVERCRETGAYTRRNRLLDNVNPIVAAAKAAGLKRGPDAIDKVVVLEPPLPIPYGTHHTKMCLCVNGYGLRVAIFTANFIHADWANKAQGIYVQDFPRKAAASKVSSERGREFAKALHGYLKKCGLVFLTRTDAELHGLGCFGAADFLEAFDFSQARVSLVPSVPGSYTGDEHDVFGMNRLSSVVRRVLAAVPRPVPGSLELSWQYSSQGALNPKFLAAMQEAMSGGGASKAVREVRVVYPTEDEVRGSVEGWRAGLSLPVHVRSCHEFVNARLHKWGPSEETLSGTKRQHEAKYTESSDRPAQRVCTGSSREDCCDVDAESVEEREEDQCWERDPAPSPSPKALWRYVMPHIKSYAAVVQPEGAMHWFLLTSANLSQAAWGTPTHPARGQPKLFIRSYELGVLYDFSSGVNVNADGTATSTDEWPTVTPSRRPLRLPTRENAPHLYEASFITPADGAAAAEPVRMFSPYNVLSPTPYASTAALRAAEGDGTTPTPGKPVRVSHQDVPWVVDMPHRGADALGKTIDQVAENPSLYGEASWLAPVHSRP